MNALYEYLLSMKIATKFNAEIINDDVLIPASIECYATSEAMLSLLRGLNFNDDGLTCHAELINSCTWLLTRD